MAFNVSSFLALLVFGPDVRDDLELNFVQDIWLVQLNRPSHTRILVHHTHKHTHVYSLMKVKRILESTFLY